MNVTIMGSGGIGGCIGGRLAASGADVVFLARGAHLEALQTCGLRLTSALGDLNIPSVSPFANANAQPPADFVIFTVKGPETVAAAELIAPVVGSNTAIITFQKRRRGSRYSPSAIRQGHCFAWGYVHWGHH